MLKDDLWNAFNTLPDNKQIALKAFLFPKNLLSSTELVNDMERRGIKFDIISKESAIHFLSEHNYYFKLAAYRANYAKYPCGQLSGKYINLDFAYLKELSTIDMHLRYLILQMCLDIEHQLKVLLIHDIENNPDEDGYNIVRLFDPNKSRQHKFMNQAKTSYAKNLIEKYAISDYPIWAFCELIDFGTFCHLYEKYIRLYKDRKHLPKYSYLYSIRNLRNASAHSNCLIYKLPLKNANVNADISNIISRIPTITESSRITYLKIQPIHDIAVLLYLYSNYVRSEGLVKKRRHDLYKLFFVRMKKHKEYFFKNEYITNSYIFCTKLIEHFFYHIDK